LAGAGLHLRTTLKKKREMPLSADAAIKKGEKGEEGVEREVTN